ncbi:FAD-dependent oxidoreductase [Larkinella bovis]|uniref:FAD-dependent oxidoreductase n=1 Tax=Larkinella bovis TaxID=683041 RepID=A0ABW0IBQ2_9BACT
MIHVDLLVVGAGSGGIGAALAAARLGATVVLVEQASQLGGNAAVSGVSVWEMGVGGTGIPFDIYKRMKRFPGGVGIYRFNKHRKWQLLAGETPVHPGAEILVDPTLTYRDTLRRYGSVTGIENESFVRQYWHGVPFEPAVYQQVVEEMLAETGRCQVLKNTSFKQVNYRQGHIESIELTNGQTYSALTYIDSTDSGVLCQAAGCTRLSGQESAEVFGEPSAPAVATQKRNGVTLIYRVTPKETASVDPLPDDIPEACWWADAFPVASVVQYPNGDLNVNMLPTMEGVEWAEYPDRLSAYAECRRRVFAHWHHIQSTYSGYRSYQLSWMAPALGVRESSRILGEYVLTEQRIRAGLSGQDEPDLITIADHALDTHGKSTGRAGCAELDEPYGVPFRCLIPKGFDNLLIASRAASFSSLAASSCRLSRTMMQLGQAAGTAAWLAQKKQIPVVEVPYTELRGLLQEQHVQLTEPMPNELLTHLANE